MLWLADRVDEGLELYRQDQGISETWAARQRVVVALTGGPESETLLRRGAVVAGRSAGVTSSLCTWCRVMVLVIPDLMPWFVNGR